MYCMFCYSEYFDTGQSSKELDLRRKNRQQICQAFCKTVRVELGVQPQCNLGKDALDSCCDKCLHVINNYRKLAFQARSYQLRLNWQTEQLLGIIEGADSNAGKHKRFQKNFICPEDVPRILKFRKEIMEKGANELQSQEPKVVLERLSPLVLESLAKTAIARGIGIIEDKGNKNEISPLTLKISAITSLHGCGHQPLESGSEVDETFKATNVRTIDNECREEDGETIDDDEMGDSNPDSFYDYGFGNDEINTQKVSERDPLAPTLALSYSQESGSTTGICQNEHLDLTGNNISDKTNFKLPNHDLVEIDIEHDMVGSGFVCHIPGCGKSFDNKISYQWHHIRHEGRQEMTTCPHAGCGKLFINDNFLRQHLKIHNAVPLSSSSSAVQKKWICGKCNMRYSTKFNLIRHFRNQHQSGSSGNEVAGATASPRNRGEQKQGNLPHRKQERVIGIGSLQRMFKKPGKSYRWRSPEYRCPICEKMCQNSVKLNEHMRTHSGERPFSCAFCTGRFATKSNLKRHVRLVHNLSEILEPKIEC